MLSTISMKQALDVWSDLEAAYYGKHGYGGTVAEIYGYRLMSYDPGIQHEHLRDKSKIELGNQAAAALCALLVGFKERHSDCVIFLNGFPFAPTQFCLDHRCHVEIIRHEPATASTI